MNVSTATISITDLRLRTLIGFLPWEKEKKQDVVISIQFMCDIARCISSDDVADTVDYKKIKDDVVAFVEQSQHNLIEKLAAEIARITLANPGVQSVRVRVDKPGALRYADSVSVELTAS